MNLKNLFQSNSISKVIFVLAILLIALVIFQAGLLVGYHKGSFTNNWNNNYMMRGSNDPRSFFAPFMHDGDDVNPNGAIGDIISINFPLMMIKGQGRAEQVIIVNPKTTIRNFRQIASTSDLTVGKTVVVIGEPNEQGEINASFIRIMPPTSKMMSTSTWFR